MSISFCRNTFMKMAASIQSKMSDQDLYLFHLVHDLIEFRFPELEAVCEFINRPKCITNHNYTYQSPVFTCNLPNEQVAFEIAQRSFLLKSISKLISQADNLDGLLSKIESKSFPFNFVANDTFKIDVYTFGKIYSQEEKLEKIEKLVDACKFEESRLKVCLNDKLVKHRFFYIEEWLQTESNLDDEFENENLENLENEKNSNKKYLRQCYFGKFLCNGQNSIAYKYNLKDRGFIGNTSMDPLLSLIMANMAHVNGTSFIYDPFVGTGSLLVGAAHFGAHVAGADLDYNLIHSRGLSSRMGQKYRKKDETIKNNLKQYGFESKFVDILAADFSTKYIKDSFLFDAIITDPPYGIREKTKKIGNKKKLIENNNNEINHEIDEKSSFNLPQHTKYNLGDIFFDLLDFSASHLIPNGRLVYWLPIYLEVDRAKMSTKEIKEKLTEFVPVHKELELLGLSEQRLTRYTSRILITMKKKLTNNSELDSCFSAIKLFHANEDNLSQTEKKTDLLNQFRDKYFSTKKN